MYDTVNGDIVKKMGLSQFAVLDGRCGYPCMPLWMETLSRRWCGLSQIVAAPIILADPTDVEMLPQLMLLLSELLLLHQLSLLFLQMLRCCPSCCCYCQSCCCCTSYPCCSYRCWDAAPVAVATVRVAVAAPVVLATEDVNAMDVFLATLRCWGIQKTRGLSSLMHCCPTTYACPVTSFLPP